MASIIKVDQIQTAAGGTPTAADLGINTSGGVIQTVSGVIATSQDTNTSTTYANLGNGISITPTESSSKFVVMLHVMASNSGGQNQDNELMYRIVRDIGGTITELQVNTHRCYDYGGSGVYLQSSNNWILYDDPATTSTITYRLQGKSVKNNAGAQILGEVSSGNMWIVQEIAG